MVDVVLKINNTSINGLLSTYDLRYEVTYVSSLTTLSGTEYGKRQERPVLTVSFIPLTDAQCASLYALLEQTVLSVQYTDPNAGTTRTAEMRVASNLGAAFALRSVDGNRRYKGAQIVLRGRTVL